MSPRDVLRLVGGISIAAIMMALTRCASAPPAPPVAAMDLVAQRNSALLVCGKVNATADLAHACEDAVRAVYCGDGGSLVSTGACSDGDAK